MPSCLPRPVTLTLATALLLAPALAGAAPDPALVGHYYLSGVRETGSELLLRADGSFAWAISYGAVDQSVEGRWTRAGEVVTLHAAAPDRTKPLFEALDREDWSAQAEQVVLDARADAAAEAAQARCPFIGGAAADAVESPRAATGAEAAADAPSPARLRAEAAAALSREAALRREVEHRAAAALADQDPGSARAAAAAEAWHRWTEAWSEARRTAQAAGLGRPDLPGPILPAACAALPAPDAATMPPGQWLGGIAVRVVEPTYRQGIRGVVVTLDFADGHTERVQTAGRGLAIRPGPAPQPVVAVSLSFPPAAGRDQRFAVAPITRGVLHFGIDGHQLVEPPFTTLRLRIEGRALIPEDMGRGRYERGG